MKNIDRSKKPETFQGTKIDPTRRDLKPSRPLGPRQDNNRRKVTTHINQKREELKKQQSLDKMMNLNSSSEPKMDYVKSMPIKTVISPITPEQKENERERKGVSNH